MRCLAACLIVAGALGACALERPIHPMRLEGFPGAPISGALFPLEPGTSWTFADRLNPERPPLRLSLEQVGDRLLLRGTSGREASVRLHEGYLEVLHEGEVVDRPLPLQGKVGDSWRWKEARYTAFGYDRIEVLGRDLRALVVAAERGAVRDLYWFAEGYGWVRIRTERQGRAIRDAMLSAYEPGRAN